MAKLQQIASDEQFEYLCLTGISHIRWRVVFREVHACNTSWCGELMLMLLRVLWRWMLCEECLTFLVCGIHLIPPESVGTWRCDMWKECYDGYKSIHMQKSYSIQAREDAADDDDSEFWLMTIFCFSCCFFSKTQPRIDALPSSAVSAIPCPFHNIFSPLLFHPVRFIWLGCPKAQRIRRRAVGRVDDIYY